MLNPSTADALVDDATIRKLIGFSKKWGYGGFIVRNLFAIRSRDPKILKTLDHPTRCGNSRGDTELIEAAKCPNLYVGWGANETFGRADEFCQILRIMRESHLPAVRCLKIVQSGNPAHPLFIPYDTEPIEWPLSDKAKEPYERANDSRNPHVPVDVRALSSVVLANGDEVQDRQKY